MVTLTELFTLSKTYPLISIIVAIILFAIGLKITTKLIKWILWLLAAIALIAAIVMIFW